MKSRRFDVSTLTENINNIRNVCILAHVDHGKTTLADSLLASNGIISSRSAGKLRYMDNLEEEQERGITMKSSCVALMFNSDPPTGDQQKTEDPHKEALSTEFLINLIDSPGHIDFSSEVSTAVRLCDNAIIVVDVVDGVCPQTRAVLGQAWQERLKPVLVLNKMDRLILELKLSTEQAYLHLCQLIENLNSVVAEFFTSDVMAQHTGSSATQAEDGGSLLYDWSSGLETSDDSRLYFAPEHGNVVFASAWDGWGFRVSDFARIYTVKLGCNEQVLCRTLWGDFYLTSSAASGEAKTPRIVKGALTKGKKPLFVSLILDQLWSVYRAREDKEAMAKIVTALNVKVLPRDLRQADGRAVVSTVCSQWLPIARSVLTMVTQVCPSVRAVTADKVDRLLTWPGHGHSPAGSEVLEKWTRHWDHIREAYLSCDGSEEAPVIAFVSKMFKTDRPHSSNDYRPVTLEELRERKDRARQDYFDEQARLEGASSTTTSDVVIATTDDAEDEGDLVDEKGLFVAFARIFSGRLVEGQKLFVLGARFNPRKVPESLWETSPFLLPEGPVPGVKHAQVATLHGVFQLIGRELLPPHKQHLGLPAGNVVGVTGLGGLVVKSATLSSSLLCPGFTDMTSAAKPIICVALEPSSSRDIARLERALRVLERADPCVELRIESSGEVLLYAAGEVHLQKCLDDIRKIYAPGIEIQVSPFIVPFRETITAPSSDTADDTGVNNEPSNHASAAIGGGTQKQHGCHSNSVVCVIRPANKPGLRLCVRLAALPLTSELVEFIESRSALIKDLIKSAKLQTTDPSSEDEDLVVDFERDLFQLLSSLKLTCGWTSPAQVWALGPEQTGVNVLINQVPGLSLPSPWTTGGGGGENAAKRSYSQAVVNGFRAACSAGPLCQEPLRACVFLLQDIWEEEVTKEEPGECDSANGGQTSAPQVTVLSRLADHPQPALSCSAGQLTAAVTKACHQAFQASPEQRLMLAMYTVDLQARSDVLGRMYAVLGRRQGQILSEELREGENVFSVRASLPVIESFGLSGELLKKTSGLALPQLRMSHWEALNHDPLTEPDEEVEEGREDWMRGHRYLNMVRRRKGLAVRQQLVECAEKQRNLSRKK